MADSSYPALFEGVIPNATTQYVGVRINEGVIGLHIGWKDATSSATIALEYSSLGPLDAPVGVAGDAWAWIDSGETITGPSATAADGELVSLENVRQKRARLVIVTTADSDLVIQEGVTRR